MWKNKKAIIGFIISTLFVVLIFYNIDLKELFYTFKQFNLKNTILIVTIYGLSMILRALRWDFLLKRTAKYSFFKLLYAWVIGNLMNVFFPARAGDIWRAYEIGVYSQESKMKLFGSVMLERILDGVSICIILSLCILMYANISWLKNIANFSMILFGGCLLFFYLLIKFEKVDNLCKYINKITEKTSNNFILKATNKLCRQFNLFVKGFNSLKSKVCTVVSLSLSFLIWVLECLIVYYVITSFGVNCPFSATMFVVCLVALGTMIPSSSIFVGPYQYAFILALGLYHIDKSEALAFALIHQSILMGALLLFSLILFVFNYLWTFNNNKN